MIEDIEVSTKILHFHEPFKIAYEEVESVKIVVVKLITKSGIIGLGAASPDEEVTGETVTDVSKALKNQLNSHFFKHKFTDVYSYHDIIQNKFTRLPSAAHAVEEAIWNIVSQSYSLPLNRLFGGYRDLCPLSITIGIKDERKTVAEVKLRLQQGYRMIKLKIGLDVDEDIKRIMSVIEVLPEDARIMLDANQGYSLKQASRLVTVLEKLPVEFIEQPVAADAHEDFKSLKKITGIPLVADESVVRFEDGLKLMTQNYVDGINIKLMKCGGVINFMRLFHLAKALNKKIMIGCMYESNISITTGTALALALPIDFTDLDSGPVDFYDDIVSGGAKISEGNIFIDSPLELNTSL